MNSRQRDQHVTWSERKCDLPFVDACQHAETHLHTCTRSSSLSCSSTTSILTLDTALIAALHQSQNLPHNSHSMADASGTDIEALTAAFAQLAVKKRTLSKTSKDQGRLLSLPAELLNDILLRVSDAMPK